MAKYRNEANIKLKQDEVYIIPHGGDDNEQASTVTRATFKAGDSLRFVKQQLTGVLLALGLTRTEAKRYMKQAFKELYV